MNTTLRIIYFLLIVLLINSENAAAQNTPAIKCDKDRMADEYTSNPEWNKYLNDACAFIQNQDYKSASACLEKALKISDDAYIQNVYDRLKSIIESNNSSSAESGTQKETENSSEKKPTLYDPLPPANNNNDESINLNSTSKNSEQNKKEESQASNSTTDNISNSEIKNEKKEEPVNTNTTLIENKENENTNIPERTLSADELEKFHDRGVQKMHRFEEYLNKIGDKSLSASDALESIENALKLFNGENHYVEVSSTETVKKNRWPVRKYLERVRALNYDYINVEWAIFEYAPKFRKAPDGNYYGYIEVRQKFSGIRDGITVYEDVTDKIVTVIIKPYMKAQEGTMVEDFEVFLGDIDVRQTAKK